MYGQYPNPPVDVLTVSNEVDLHAARYDPDNAFAFAGVSGYGSPFIQMHGFSVDAVDPKHSNASGLATPLSRD